MAIAIDYSDIGLAGCWKLEAGTRGEGGRLTCVAIEPVRTVLVPIDKHNCPKPFYSVRTVRTWYYVPNSLCLCFTIIYVADGVRRLPAGVLEFPLENRARGAKTENKLVCSWFVQATSLASSISLLASNLSIAS